LPPLLAKLVQGVFNLVYLRVGKVTANRNLLQDIVKCSHRVAIIQAPAVRWRLTFNEQYRWLSLARSMLSLCHLMNWPHLKRHPHQCSVDEHLCRTRRDDVVIRQFHQQQPSACPASVGLFLNVLNSCRTIVHIHTHHNPSDVCFEWKLLPEELPMLAFGITL